MQSIRPSAALPDMEVVPMGSMRCSTCGRPLPEFRFKRIVGPWSDKQIRDAALLGQHNKLDCTRCGATGTVEYPSLICAPEHGVIYIVGFSKTSLPEQMIIEDELLALLSKLAMENPEWTNLPIVRVEMASQIPRYTSMLSGACVIEAEMQLQRISRLAMTPAERTAAFVDAVVDLSARVPAMESLHEPGGAPATFAELRVQLTAWEASPLPLSLVESEIKHRLADPKFLENQAALEELLAWLPELAGMAPTRVDEHPDRRILSVEDLERFFPLPKLSNGEAMEGEALRDQRQWESTIRNLASTEPLLALDLAVAYFTMRRYINTIHDLRILVHVGIAQRYFGNIISYPGARQNLALAAGLFERFSIDQTPEGTELLIFNAVAYELLGHSLKVDGELFSGSRRYFLDAGRLFILGRDFPGVKRCVGGLCELAALATDIEIKAEAHELFNQLPLSEREEGFEALFNPFETLLPEPPAPDANTHEEPLPAVFIEFTEDWDAHPRADDPKATGEQKPYSIPAVSGESEVIRGRGAWFRQNYGRLPLDIGIDRIFEEMRKGELARSKQLTFYRYIVTHGGFEQVMREELAGHKWGPWLDAASDETDRRKRWVELAPLLWIGAAHCGAWLWLEGQIRGEREKGGVAEDFRATGATRTGNRAAFMVIAAAKAASSDLWNEKDRLRMAGLGLEIIELSKQHRGASTGNVELDAKLTNSEGVLRELVGDLEGAIKSYRRNIRLLIRLREWNAESTQRIAIQGFVGYAAAARLVRCLLKSQSAAQGEILFEMFEALEVTRSPVLFDRIGGVLTSGGVPSASPHPSSAAIHRACRDPSYLQLSLVQSTMHTRGCWLALIGARDILQKHQLDFDEPLSIYEALGGIDSSNDVLAPSRITAFRRAADWARGVLKLMEPENTLWVSANAYLLYFPWSMCGVLLGVEIWEDEPVNRIVGVAFSAATLEAVLKKPALLPSAFRGAAFIDPLDDLRRMRSDLIDALAPLSEQATEFHMHTGLQASSAKLLTAAIDADVLVFVGHGFREGEGASSLVCALGKMVGSTHLLALGRGRPGRPRLAVVLSCWGARFELERTLANWESEGIPYGLKACGFDYVVTALWPISLRMAADFLAAFAAALAGGATIPESFQLAYKKLIQLHGVNKVLLEAGSLQLIV